MIMKLIYRKTLTFPLWAKFDVKNAEKQFYSLTANGVKYTASDEVLPHFNHIEMAGFEASSIISYRISKNRKLKLYILCVFPQIRVNPNVTQGSFTYHFQSVDFKIKKEECLVKSVFLNGDLRIEQQSESFDIVRQFFPAYDKKALVENIIFTNKSSNSRTVFLDDYKACKKISGCYFADKNQHFAFTKVFYNNEPINSKQKFTVEPGKSITLTVCYSAEALDLDEITNQIDKRQNFIGGLKNNLSVSTPDNLLNKMTELCKIRACESIFNTKNGLMHGPGGGNYYAALWTNDQCEYANPLFAYLGYKKGQEQSLNCYRLYSRLASSDKAIPTSIVACGDGIWNGAGDRGDTSMYLYGLCRYLLTTGDRKTANELMPSIEKAVDYVVKNITDDYIVKSDSDELENRFESGKANLSTSCITYDAFISLGYLYRSFGNNDRANYLLSLAEKIKMGIEQYFGADVEGYDAYRYCNEERRLRSWICLPLTVGIFERKDETINALLSNKLYKNGGFLTRSGDKTYWDRSALYAIRGLFYSNEADKALDVLENYSKERLLGCHPPYPVEAFPEGNSAQLSAESALYLRIFTEGVLGYRPTGFDSFEIKPSLPKKWDRIDFNKLNLFGEEYNISVINGDYYTVKINGYTIEIAKGDSYAYHRKEQ